VLILVIAALCVYILPSPWAFHIGGKFSPFGEWDGYGPVQASSGGRYLLYTHLRGGSSTTTATADATSPAATR